jgi:RimJ/RimL family protein N-acetyltransferase
MHGRFCRLEPLSAAAHTSCLFSSHSLDHEGRNGTYLPDGPFASLAEYARWVEWAEAQRDPQFFAIVDGASGQAAGTASYLRSEPAMGAIAVGHLAFSPLLQRTTAATEVMYRMMRRAFAELGYQRYERKCNSLNAPSVAAAKRIGFTFEGTFRQMHVVKGRNRDTSWLSIIDGEWPALKRALEGWLAPENFDAAGKQRRSLAELRAAPPPSEAGAGAWRRAIVDTGRNDEPASRCGDAPAPRSRRASWDTSLGASIP